MENLYRIMSIYLAFKIPLYDLPVVCSIDFDIDGGEKMDRRQFGISRL